MYSPLLIDESDDIFRLAMISNIKPYFKWILKFRERIVKRIRNFFLFATIYSNDFWKVPTDFNNT